ncbi:MAG TPA: LssY C-terminal domain-containing protein [Candidatus Sulfotelmatobacter sp.]|nr:LssY C-terminal domain-containing protein [Candidatus Sulfotelmatobacter sp.]
MRRAFVWVASLWAITCAANIASAQLLRNDSASQAAAAGQSATPTASVPTGKRRVAQDVTISGDQTWVDTGITVQPGEHIMATVSGKMHYSDNQTDADATGLARNFKDLIRILPYNAAGRGAVIGRVGDATFAQPFLVGLKCNVISYSGGALSIGLNQMSIDTGTGSYTVHVEIYPPDSTFIAVKQVQTMPGIDPALFSKIPRRIADKAGDPGDMVNFLIIGNEDAMKNVFQTAGWVHVDADVKATFLHGFMESMSKDSYLTMPMSILYLFGRPQDYGWAHAEPIQVVASRNHLRIWKAPFEVNGEMTWVGAATHDIGFERDQRNNGITHKIDPDIDLERNYVEKTLTSTGLVSEVEHYLPDNPLKTAKTATGGEFHSDGHVLILKLSPAATTATTASTTH